MDTSKFDKRIQTLQKRIEKASGEMEKTTVEFKAAAVNLLRRFYRSRAEHVVKTRTTQTQKIGAVGVGEIKERLRDLTEHMPETVEERLNRNSLWYHRTPSTEGSPLRRLPKPSDYEPGKYSQQLDRALQAATDPLDALLQEQGYPPKTHYEGQVSWSKKMEDLKGRYYKQATELGGLRRSLEEVEKERAAAIAGDLWDSTR